MKKLILSIIVGVIILVSCKKDDTCQGCSGTNKAPIVNAGADQTITLPTDSVLLDGSASTDPDGTIVEWEWKKISGPASFTFFYATISKPVVKNLQAGIYFFELMVKDNDGLSTKDTIQIIVTDVVQPNRPPITYAGPDQMILASTGWVFLSGIGSSDPDNNISSYLWTKISGPASFNIFNVNEIQTPALNLVVGTYQFVLKATDAGGLFDTDTVQIIVHPIVPPTTCIIPGATQVGTFSSQRTDMNSVVFKDKFYLSSFGFIEIFDPVTNTLTNAQNLSISRWGIGTVATSDKIFFAGGYDIPSTQVIPISRVDIYSSTNGTWSTAELSTARFRVCAATVGDKVFFAGGYTTNSSATARMDIYNISTNSWSDRTLSKPGHHVSAVVENKIWLVAEGSNLIDVYDPVTNNWSIITLSFSITSEATITLNNKVYFTGNSVVQVYDISSRSWSSFTLSENKSYVPAGISNNKIVFIGGMTNWDTYSNRMEIYDPATGSLSTQFMSSDLFFESIISYNNFIYSAGGLADQENTIVYSICRFQL